MAIILSEYAQDLPDEVKNRYMDKLKFIKNIDPYTLGKDEFINNLDEVPKMCRKDIAEYLLLHLSAYSQKEVRAYKSMDAYAHVVCGWVKAIFVKKYNNNFLVRGKVLHSQRIREKSLSPWVIISVSDDSADMSGNDSNPIKAAHCDCVAGLGEVCTHVAAILYSLLLRSDLSCTEKLCAWVVPTKSDDINLSVSDIDFHNPHLQDDLPDHPASSIMRAMAHSIPTPSSSDIHTFLVDYRDDVECVLHDTLSAFKIDEPDVPIIPCLYSEDNIAKTLLELSGNYFMDVTEKQVQDLERITREQSRCELWHKARVGRITASLFKAVCRTKVEKPSVSLLRQICYPPSIRKAFKQTSYGCNHEKDALQRYIEIHCKDHVKAYLASCGFFVDPKYPFFGASPDSVINCEGCGNGIIEVKCPYCARDSTILLLVDTKNFSIQTKEGKMQLDRKHSYYYQIQMQLAITKFEWCDFVVWSNKDLYVERIQLDKEFWKENSYKAAEFFSKVILPELRAKYFTRETKHTTATPKEKTKELWCYCQFPDDGNKMVKCDREDCTIKWFHRKCLDLKRLPKKFVCNNCKK